MDKKSLSAEAPAGSGQAGKDIQAGRVFLKVFSLFLRYISNNYFKKTDVKGQKASMQSANRMDVIST